MIARCRPIYTTKAHRAENYMPWDSDWLAWDS